jgi:tRNA-dihydrouridine synthase B
MDRILGDGPILAPLCGISDSPFRRICRRWGAGLLFSEMISAEGLSYGAGGTWRMLGFHPEELPLVVQLSSADPEAMAEAARIIADLDVTAININMGCPARKVVKGDKGAGLMRDPDQAARVVEAMVAAVGLPITVKMRAGWDADSINALSLAHRIQEAGAAAVILHPRTRTQAYKGSADWSLIREMKETLSIPVVGNGDVVDQESALRMMEETGCDRVMIGRASFGRPWIFSEVRAALEGRPTPPPPNAAEIFGIVEAQISWALDDFPQIVAVRTMRKHILWYSRGLPNAAAFRQHLCQQETAVGQLAACRRFFLEQDPGGAPEAP